jgi:hypothetical protein
MAQQKSSEKHKNSNEMHVTIYAVAQQPCGGVYAGKMPSVVQPACEKPTAAGSICLSWQQSICNTLKALIARNSTPRQANRPKHTAAKRLKQIFCSDKHHMQCMHEQHAAVVPLQAVREPGLHSQIWGWPTMADREQQELSLGICPCAAHCMQRTLIISGAATCCRSSSW